MNAEKKYSDRKPAPLKKGNQESIMATNYEKRTAMAFNYAYQQPLAWRLDRRCTSHKFKDRNLFTEFPPHINFTIQLAVDKKTKITGIETILITVPSGSGITNLTLKNDLCVPELNVICYQHQKP